MEGGKEEEEEESLKKYGTRRYWEERYGADETMEFDWYLGYEDLRAHLQPYLRYDNDFEVLIAGCGNSPLSKFLHRDGVHNLTHVDASKVVIGQMRERYAHYQEMEFLEADACLLDRVPSNCFDLVLDKAMVDSMLCNPEDGITRVRDFVHEAFRVLRGGGHLISVSHGPPETRKGYFQSPSVDWNLLDVIRIAKPSLLGFEAPSTTEKFYYMYVMQKKTE